MRLSGREGPRCRGGRGELFAGLDFDVAAGDVLRGGAATGRANRRCCARSPGCSAGGGKHQPGGRRWPSDRCAEQCALSRPPAMRMKPRLRCGKTWHSGATISGPAEIGVDERARDGRARGLADLPAAYLSAGQRRRLSHGPAPRSRRPVWLLDEPTAALDRAGEALLAGLIATHLAGGGMRHRHAPRPPLGTGARELRHAGRRGMRPRR